MKTKPCSICSRHSTYGSHTEHLRAKRNAARLAKLCGKGWRGRTWDNLGWHYSAENGRHSISEWTKNKRYCLFFNTRTQIVTEGRSPQIVIRKAREIIAEMSREAANL